MPFHVEFFFFLSIFCTAADSIAITSEIWADLWGLCYTDAVVGLAKFCLY